MFGRVGIIPAAGNALRFGGYQKEMLLTPEGDPLLLRAYQTMDKCDAVIVVTRPELVTQQANLLPPGAIFIKQDGGELIGAVKTALKIEASEYCFAMPDTYYPEDVFYRTRISNIDLGMFFTFEPERFGVYHLGKIRDKDQSLKGTRQKAWGVLMWDAKVAELWRSKVYASFDHALNHAMTNCDHSTFKIDYYYDMATFEDYRKFICNLH